MILNINTLEYGGYAAPENAVYVDLFRQMLAQYGQPSVDSWEVRKIFTKSGLEQFCRWAKKYKNLTVELVTWETPQSSQSPHVLILDITEDEFFTLAVLKFKGNSSDHTS